MKMLTDQEIQELIASPKRITSRSPAKDYAENDGHRRGTLVLEDFKGEEGLFEVFIRQNSQFIENYSIGLCYQTKIRHLNSITLARYNGPHGESSREGDGHYARPHIHWITAEEVQSGSLHPQEKHRKVTEKYDTFEEALGVFFEDMGIMNWMEYFPELIQRSLFNGPR